MTLFRTKFKCSPFLFIGAEKRAVMCLTLSYYLYKNGLMNNLFLINSNDRRLLSFRIVLMYLNKGVHLG